MSPIRAFLSVMKARREARRCEHKNVRCDWYDFSPVLQGNDIVYVGIERCNDCGRVTVR